MQFILQRIHRDTHSIDGCLKLNGEKICDTAECTSSALSPGLYYILPHRCRQHQRFALLLLPVLDGSTATFAIQTKAVCQACSQCPRLRFVGPNSVMPRVCPMLTVGTGVRGRVDGSIIIGQRLVYGTLLHSYSHYRGLSERLRKVFRRMEPVTLRIV